MTTEKNDQENTPVAAGEHSVAEAVSTTSGKKKSAEPSASAVKKTEKKADPSTRRGPHLLSWINLLLILVLLVLAAYVGWLGWQQQQQTVAQIAVLGDRLAQTRDEAGALATTEGDLLVQTQTLVKQTETLKQQVDHNTDRLGKLPGAERQDWLLAEAEYLLRIASQRLQLERDWEGALSMLQAADNVLVETRNPRLNPVRATLARDMLTLRTAPALDLTGAVLRLQALQEQIPQLPWLPDRLLPEAAAMVATADTDAPARGEQPWYATLWQTVSSSLMNMVRIRERNGPVAAPLTPDQQYYLQQNMHLMLEQAQVALLRQQADLYTHSLKRVNDWLTDYLLINDQRTRAVQSSLAELMTWDVAPALPDISGSLLQLQALVEQQRRGTVLPLPDAEDAQ